MKIQPSTSQHERNHNFAMFKEKFKYYKSKCPPPSFDDVLDFSKTTEFSKVEKFEVVNGIIPEITFSNLGLNAPKTWSVYRIINRPGLIYIRNPFTDIGQRYWIRRCLADYSRKPNKLNLDAFGDLGPDEDWWSACQSGDACKTELLKKLRWATLGYHHDWNTKVYCESTKNEFPADLAKLSNIVASLACDCPDFSAQAAIINYYHNDSTLSGHKDYSEMNMEAPLLSFSFGQSAIFLVGSETLEEEPTALFLHSGDIVIMYSQCRQAYHGVPRIVPATIKPWLNVIHCNDRHVNISNCIQDQLLDNSEWKPFNSYLETSRINMNVRQVLLPGQKEIKS